MGLPARIGGRCLFTRLPLLPPDSVGQASCVGQGYPRPGALQVPSSSVSLCSPFPTGTHPQMGRAAEPVYAAQGSASPSLPPKPLVQTLRIVVFQQLFCKRASKSMLLPKVGVGGPRTAGPRRPAPSYLHRLRSVDEPVVLRTPDEQIDLRPRRLLQRCGWGLPEVLAVDHGTPVVERAAHGQELRWNRGVPLFTWVLSVF